MKAQGIMLGSGTSTGVPVIGCDCETCTSDDPRNRRSRTSMWFRIQDRPADPERPFFGLLIDTSTDFREQALREKIPRIDAVLYTHAHADHIFGLDDLRIYNFRQRQSIPTYGSALTLRRIRHAFSYIFEDGQEGGGKPNVTLETVEGSFKLSNFEVTPIPVMHGELAIFGYRLGDFAYITDCSHIPEDSMRQLEGVDQLVLGALRYREHPTHFNIDQATAVAERVGARRTVLTHLACDIEHVRDDAKLPKGVELGYDGMLFDFEMTSGAGQ